ncbi:hypothetical protein [uncultured Serinicoccus sp.]|uniref:hypothetical protein n=1 Tax=uncultured Serinicoccus sp. TaxID=735514 RepID=UPI00260CE8DB|nr:hypothetical protein [uncultured Serinicoccus sp.]
MSLGRAVLPAGVQLGRVDPLGGSARSQVHRCQVLVAPDGWGASVVVNRFLPQPEGRGAALGWRREAAGLRHLRGSPRLLALDEGTQTVVMEDLGRHPTLADALLGADADGAWRHTVAWAGALGAAVAGGVTLEAARRDLGGALAAEDRRWQVDYPRRGLGHLAEVAGIRAGRAAAAQARDLVDELQHDTARHVLGPGDACPDNALLTPAGVRLLDLEGTGVRHVAYEAAYAAEPFSTCWCVFTPPTGLTGATLVAFTAAASGAVPGLAEDADWPRQVRGAVALWVLAGTLWLLDGAMADRTMAPEGRTGPAFRALLVSRWGWVVRECADELPDVAAACEEALAWARRTWRRSDLVLPPYPAFGGG